MRKVLSIISNTIAALLFILMAGITVLMLTGNDLYVVRSGSMEPTIETGSICIVSRNVPYEDIKEGDIIAFENSLGKVTHRVTAVTEEGLETKGDANEVSDGISTNEKNYVGKTVFHLPKIGYALGFLITPKGKIIALTGITVFLLLGMLFDNSKEKEQTSETPESPEHSA